MHSTAPDYSLQSRVSTLEWKLKALEDDAEKRREAELEKVREQTAKARGETEFIKGLWAASQIAVLLFVLYLVLKR